MNTKQILFIHPYYYISDFAYTPIPVTQTFSGCQETDDVANITSSYIDSLSKSSFNALCLDHASSCSKENVIVKC